MNNFISLTKQLGNQGEEIAVKYLKKQGYKILDRNFRYKKYGELDIVAKNNQDGALVFIEVKTRLRPSGYGGQARGNNIYNPEDNITYFKQKQLIKLAKIYLMQKRIPLDISWQIDIIAIEVNPSNYQANIRHTKQAIQDFY